ncbi:hypothetical protein Q1695_012121 [Nippostrongylus brasiliensis]|nr:hypothetical protein Q1695_012121 [Nippostrongylus brasiliensis]
MSTSIRNNVNGNEPIKAKQYAERERRVSTLSRSDAIQSYHPIKQTSNPEHPRIYERGHVHSRSWNVESGERASPPRQQQADFQYYQMNEVYPSDRPYIPTINEPQIHLGVRQFHRQAKSFDERGIPARDARRMSMDRRTMSEAERTFGRQNTAQHLHPETPVAAACQSLWAAKGHLEELHALGISDPSSASTSFESNTDNSPAAGSGESKIRDEGADKKRLQYKSSKKFRRRITVHSPVQSPTRRSSHESDASRELRNLFLRRGSGLDSRKTSESTALGDRRSSIFDDELRRKSRDLVDFNRDRRRHSRDLFYDRDLDARYASNERRNPISRRPSDIRDFYAVHNTIRQQRRNSRDVFYSLQERRLSRELPERPMFVDSQDTLTRRNSRGIDDRRSSRNMEPLYERSERSERQRRRSSFIRHAAVSHDTNFWHQAESSNAKDSRSLFLRRKFLSTAAVSSLDSTNSTESSAPEAIFASSVDSAGSDLEHRRLSLLNRVPTGSMPLMISRALPVMNPAQNAQRQRLRNRDYSVDAQSDTLFREWSRVDPAYEEQAAVREHPVQRGRLDRGASVDQNSLRSNNRQRAYSRQMTANPSGNVMVPFICYPDEANCSR